MFNAIKTKILAGYFLRILLTDFKTCEEVQGPKNSQDTSEKWESRWGNCLARH